MQILKHDDLFSDKYLRDKAQELVDRLMTNMTGDLAITVTGKHVCKVDVVPILRMVCENHAEDRWSGPDGTVECKMAGAKDFVRDHLEAAIRHRAGDHSDFIVRVKNGKVGICFLVHKIH